MTNLQAVSECSAAEEPVESVVKGYCEAWNAHDMKALAEVFADDAHWINIVGMHWRGKPAVVAGHAAYHQTFFRTTGIEMINVEIREISPDVAAAVIVLNVDPFTPPDGFIRPSSEDRLSLILTKQSGRWLIAHGHNTVIDRGAQPFDPVKTGWPNAAANSAR
jgi:uncharacterized protein (TIGR02246 family)